MIKIFHKYYPVRNLLFFMIEGGLIFLSIWMVILLIYSGSMPYDPEKISIWARILLIGVLIQLIMYYHDLYEFRYKTGMFELSVKIVQSIGVSCLILAGLYYFFPQLVLEQGIFFIGIFIMLSFLVSWRIIYQYAAQRKLWNEKIVILGDGNLARMISDEVRQNLDSGYSISAFFSNPGKSGLAEELGVEKKDDYDQLCEYALHNGISKIVVALEERRGRSPIQSLLNCKMQGIKVLDGVSFYEQVTGKILAGSIPPSWLVFSDGFRRSRLTILAKRGLDIVFSLTGILLSAPVQIAAAVLVKTTSPGPVFYKQVRVGQMGRQFKVIKFRTMRQDAEAKSGAVWAEEDDPRITPVGKIFRKLRIDELPQFWNVIKGEMSFVGPRPERPVFVEQLKTVLPYYGERHTVKPGITGWAQVSYPYGASEDDALRKLEYDLFYIKHLSLIFDLYIVLKTVKTVLAGSGAR
ncbi:TIGR03013 family XrtA/PEP-CTERM system glycosyltransferase [Desulfonatronovibrio hydrogenovorans]|uniref:TIGR03013 family XrtA/PEP-CTERM system glycosyltransferase n=1 Tax=Desulfonatronovibrio hydrogenovorans TaxID=53245 RepID=UPI00048A6BF5|nr:TIGR03013 family XrtA/PEP-CTERM system glycosyltransferase [Desulfonatronovibrio hydrogenovorans]